MLKNEVLIEQNGVSATVSLKDWLKLYLIALIGIVPVIGWIAVLVIYCMIGFGKETSPSVANNIKAVLIFAVISFIVSFLFAAIVGHALIGGLMY